MAGKHASRRDKRSNSFGFRRLASGEALERRDVIGEWLTLAGTVMAGGVVGALGPPAAAEMRPSERAGESLDRFESRRWSILPEDADAVTDDGIAMSEQGSGDQSAPMPTRTVRTLAADDPVASPRSNNLPALRDDDTPPPESQSSGSPGDIFPLDLASPPVGGPQAGGASSDRGAEGGASAAQARMPAVASPSASFISMAAAQQGNGQQQVATAASSSSSLLPTSSASTLASSSTSALAYSGGALTANVWTGGGMLDSMGSESAYVVEWNDGTTLSTGATEYDSEGDSVDLRAQVQGKEVASYSWNLSSAPTATDVTGASTYRLQFNWANVYYGNSVNNQIALTIQYTDQTQTTLTYNFVVINDGTGGGSGGSGGSGGGSPVSVTRPEVVTPDLIAPGLETISGDLYQIGADTGELMTGYQLPTYGPGDPGLGVVYNSEAASAHPIFLERYQLDPARGIPSTVSAKLTFNSVEGQEYYYDTSGLNPGDLMQIALQADASGLSTGRYPWRIDVTAHYTGQDVSSYTTGQSPVVNYADSAAGTGWQIAGLERLYAVTGGAVLDLGDGHSLWFASGSGGGYVTPDGDFSTLVQNVDDTFTRTLKTGEECQFDADGKFTAFVDRNGNTVSFAYNLDGTLASITDPNDRETTLAYSGGLLTGITDPADRTTGFAHDSGGRLTEITQPDSETWTYGYDSEGRITSRTDPRDYETTFAYGDAGRINGVTRPDTTSVSLDPNQLQGWLASGTGTEESPGAAVLWGSAASTYTDGRSEAWQTQFDWTGFGAATGRLDPSENLSVTHRDGDGLPIEETDALDRNTVYWRDSSGNVTTIVHPDYYSVSYEYNSFSEVTQYTDEGSEEYTYAFDTYGNLTGTTDPLDHSTGFTYTTDGLVATATDPLDHVTKYNYDSWDRLTEIILPDGTAGDEDNPRQSFEWDDAGNMTSMTDPLGNETAMAYRTMGLLVGITLPDETPEDPDDNPQYVMAYDPRGNRTSQTDPLDHETTMAYDSLGRVTSVTDPLSHQTQYGYDEEGNPTSVENALEGTTTLGYDAVGGLTSVSDPMEHATNYTRDAAGQVTGTTDPLSNTTTTSYDARGMVVRTQTEEGFTIIRAFSPQGWLTSSAESGGGGSSLTTYDRDALGRVTSVTDPLNHTTSTVFDAAGNVTSRTDGLNHTTTYGYDEQDRLVSVTDPLSHATTYEFDLAGNLVTVTDPLDRSVTTEYDAQNRVKRTVDANGAETLYAYTLAGQLESVTDDNGNVTSFGYDAAGRRTSETDPLNHDTTYAFDAQGQLTSVVDRDGRTRAFAYDDAGRRTTETWIDDQQQTVRTISFTFDDAGNLTGVSDPSATYAFSYDGDNRVTGVDNNGTSNIPRTVLTIGYDARDNRTSVSDDRGGQYTYTFDLAHKMTGAQLYVSSLGLTASATLTYDAADRLTGISRTTTGGGGGGSGGSGGSGGGTVSVDTAYTYDNANRITGISHTAGYTTLASYSLTWNAANELTQEVSNDGTANFTYDSGGQLTGVSGWRSETYTYDGLGNRTMTGYSTGTGNRLASDGTFNYTYDNEGNLLTKTEISTGKVTEYTWDYRNRLTKVQVKNSLGTVIQESNYTYDPLDNRIAVSDDPDGPGSQPATVRYTIYDGLNPYADFDGSGTLTRRYLYGPAVDQIIGRLDTSGSGTVAWYGPDDLGSVRDVISATGQVIDHLKFDSFGKILSESHPSAGDRFKFTGREYDAATGLYYYRARYYDAAIGRFLSEDPKSFSAGDANLYRCVSNSPLNHTDPTGCDWGFTDVGDLIVGGALGPLLDVNPHPVSAVVAGVRPTVQSASDIAGSAIQGHPLDAVNGKIAYDLAVVGNSGLTPGGLDWALQLLGVPGPHQEIQQGIQQIASTLNPSEAQNGADSAPMWDQATIAYLLYVNVNLPAVEPTQATPPSGPEEPPWPATLPFKPPQPPPRPPLPTYGVDGAMWELGAPEPPHIFRPDPTNGVDVPEPPPPPPGFPRPLDP